MKTPMTLLCLCMFTTTGFAKTVTNSSSLNEQVGYSFGYLMGRSNAESVKDLDLDAFILGLKTAAQGGKSAKRAPVTVQVGHSLLLSATRKQKSRSDVMPG